MSVYKNANGYWIVSDIISGYLVSRTYIGYTKREAIQRFKKETKELSK